ncbi:MAG TPA: Gfo/Idh/MocA family oxidoreductase [Candidatus Nanoarchaeia archaeon]|nr:Gfo/Idh/MocA family oxidoreductase [Candidatus Nanoarchaeia archaeon]
MIKVGVIGVGSMGQNHARIYFHSENAQLVAVSDAYEEQAKKVARHYNAKAYTNYQEMLQQEDIEAVSIAVPTSLHQEVALAALNAGKHILLEKPIAPNPEEAQSIIDKAEDKKLKLMIGHIERFNPAIQELKARLRKGELGEIYKIDVQRIGPFPSRITDVGVIVDLSVHDLDIIHYLIEDTPVRIYAETQQHLHPHHEDSVTALLRYSKGALVILNINYLSPTKVRQLRIFGKKGMFLVNYLDQELYFYENKGFTSDTWESVTEGDMKKIIISKKEPLQVEIEAFLDCVNNKGDSPVSGTQGVEVLNIAHAILKSAQEKKILEF